MLLTHSKFIAPHFFLVLGSLHSYQVCDKVPDYFHKQMYTLQQLCIELQSKILEDCLTAEFLMS